jgi:hypothetical protein
MVNSLNGVNDGVGDHFTVVHTQARLKFQTFIGFNDVIVVVTDTQNGGVPVELGTYYRVIGLSMYALAVVGD